jgi:serine/threonine-protein kinase
MGEVYRADDLTLDQPVALKFLPETFAERPERVERFYNEVRLARRVSHPNVCRVHDIGHAEDLHYLSMEYVDGEDLSSLLRRIGRLARDKALEIARQLCAGLAAAHDQGVLHRDLKPANVMLDGKGKVRITDFGLAAVAESLDGSDSRSGTPAYMAPEQLSGGEITVRSDVYALGLVLYEIFTGRRAFRADTVDELSRMQAGESPPSPSSIVREVDPVIEEVIYRCLEKDPARRPASALSVAAALPGGDPLAAALAAGETPSPEVVATAGREGALRPGVAWVLMIGFFASLAAYAALGGTASYLTKIRLPKAPALLVERAREMLREFGYTQPSGDSAEGFTREGDFVLDKMTEPPSPERWDAIGEARPSPIYFWYRESPRYMDPEDPSGMVSQSDPPRELSGMVRVRLDPEGRLIRLDAVPPQVPDPDSGSWGVDWPRLFGAAGLDLATFTETEPEWIPSDYCDELRAWRGYHPEQPGVPIRVDGGSFRGRPVHFAIAAPWTRPDRVAAPGLAERFRLAQWFSFVVLVLALFGGAYLARRNLQRGRGDWRGAFRIAGFVLGSMLCGWLVTAHHARAPATILRSFISVLGPALWGAGLLWLVYVALEPYARRRWPERIVSWSCLLTGRFRDPSVGRDLLIGGLFGSLLALTSALHFLLPPRFGLPPMSPFMQDPQLLLGLNLQFGFMCGMVPNAIVNALIFLFVPTLLLLLVRKVWLAVGIFAILLVIIGAGRNQNPPVGISLALFHSAIMIYVLMRFGLVALCAALFVSIMLVHTPVSFDFSTWYARNAMLVLAVLIALVVYGFRVSLGGRPAFGRDLLQD